MRAIPRIWLSVIIGILAEGTIDTLVAIWGKWDRPLDQQAWVAGDWLVGFFTLVHWPSIWTADKVFSVITSHYLKAGFVVVTSTALLSGVIYLILRDRDNRTKKV